MLNGIINVNKSAGFTSFDVVAKLRSVLNQRKVGHTGTLDPDATGVLPVCIGNATKVCNILTDMDKTYEAVMLLGKVTDTQDTSGTLLSVSDALPGSEEAVDTLLSFMGEYDQIPPMYSAKKVGGKKLYDLAREGKVIERKPCRVRISDITVLETSGDRIRFLMTVSKGTYIRTLCHDVGQALGCGACMESLVRRRVGPFKLEEAFTLDEIRAMKEAGTLETMALRRVDELFTDYEAVYLDSPESEKALNNGNKLSLPCTSERIRVYDTAGTFKAVYEKKGEVYKPLQMFLP